MDEAADGTAMDSSAEVKEQLIKAAAKIILSVICLLYTSPSPRDGLLSRMPSSA